MSQHPHYPATLIVDGKGVLLQRFMQDQKARHEESMQEPEVIRTVESHQRPKNLYQHQHQQEVILLPEELELRSSHRHGGEEMGPNVQKMAIDDAYATQKMDAESRIRDVHRVQEVSMGLPGMSSTDRPVIPKEQPTTVQPSYAFHDLELARQNALLTRLLLERESRHVGGAMTTDAASYLETQSLPGQVAIATQTDRAAATQLTERQARSRSDNDESDEESRSRKKTKTKKRYGESESSKRTRTLWMKSPIEEEEKNECFDKRLNILRKKVKEVKEGRKVSLEPEVLREISDSLDENGSSYPEKRGKRSPRTREKAAEESSVGYKVLGGEKNGSSSSTEVSKQRYETVSDEKPAEISSSPEISVDNGEYIRETTEKKSSRKECKVKKQKKVESIIRPSFRVLEREITMLTKKLSKLADKKTQHTAGDDGTGQEKPKTSKDSKRDSDQSTRRAKADERKRSEASPSTSKEVAAVSVKTRQKFKYQQAQIMSPGSSEYDDSLEKTKKPKAASRQEVAKQHKQPSSRSHAKMKRQTQAQVERKEHRKKIEQRARDAASKGTGVSEPKIEKTAVKLPSRAQKLAAIGRRENVMEEPSTSTSSDRVDSKKDPFAARRDFDRKSTESSDVPSISHHVDRREPKRKLARVSERFTDDFVTEQRTEDADPEDALRSVVDANLYEEDIAREAEITQQFSDDFTTGTQAKDAGHETQADAESRDETERDVSRDFGEELVTLKKIAEDVTVLRDSSTEHAQFEDESIEQLDAATERRTELLEITPRVEQIKDGREGTVPLDLLAQEAFEEHRAKRPTLHCSKCIDRAKLTDATEKHDEEAHEISHEIEEKVAREKEVTPETTDVRESKVLEDAEKSVKEETAAEGKHTESPEILSDPTKHTEQLGEEEQAKKNGLDSRTDVLPSKMDEEETKDVKDITDSSRSNGEDKAVESHAHEEEDSREESRHESKEHSEEETLPTESTIDILRKVAEELTPREIEDVSLREIKSDVEEGTKIITAMNIDDRYQDIAEEPGEISKEHITSESDSERMKEDETLTIEVLEEVSEISSRPSESETAHSSDIHPESLIERSEKTSLDVDEDSREMSRDSLIQAEPDKTTETAEADGETDRAKYNLSTEKEIESHGTVQEPHVFSQGASDLREAKLDESSKTELSTSPAEVTTSRKEVADTEQPQAEHTEEVKEASFREEHKEEAEESRDTKERSDDKTEEALGKSSPSDELKERPGDSHLEKASIGQSDTADEPETVAESVDAAGPQDQDQGEQRADVSDPIFSSFIDTLEVSEESDSSSDVSRKTTLSTRPYDTPRHRQKWQQQESLEIAVMPGIKAVGDETVTTAVETEAEGDTDSNLSLDEIESVEDSTATEAPTDEKTVGTGIATERFLLAEKIFSGEEKILAASGAEKVHVDGRQEDRGLESKLAEQIAEPEGDVKANVKQALTTIRDEVSFVAHVTELKDASKEKVEDESTPAGGTKGDMECTSEIPRETPYREIEEVPETAKPDDKSEIRSSSKQAEQADSKKERTSTEDAKVEETRVKDVEVGETRSKDYKNGAPSDVAKKETSKSPVNKKTKVERSKAAAAVAKKRVIDEESEARAASIPSRRRSRRDIDGDTDKTRKKKDDGSRIQSRKVEEEPQRKQTLPRTRAKTDKRMTIPAKSTGEIDTSKTRSKYMAWYNKKREEAEKKRLEKKAAEDEEQLPRWVSRGLKSQATKPRGRLGTDHKTPEMTPRTRRKIKPLVNVESEQLKAIVRQGRELRKAEGNLKEDPPVQIFARSPPSVSTSDAQQHRLLQHSEYKYEKAPPPFYLHPPPAPHPSPQLSPERSRFEVQPSTSQREEELRTDEMVPLQSGVRLRHQQLLEKKSVFDIAYSEAAPSQLRSDSATPPS
ncbi:hypothetical protein EAI_13110 [Harpegnathos saltator]|uniref:Uncharacterized protein n=1 Tax=Harpegnathos saltator TaxID=610380 RepID=E2BSZ0_HARSA|nr:hypothetical protein EAI_13110 [Harpegnathos saltator]